MYGTNMQDLSAKFFRKNFAVQKPRDLCRCSVSLYGAGPGPPPGQPDHHHRTRAEEATQPLQSHDTRPVLGAPNLTNLSVANLASINPQAWEHTWKTWLKQGRPPFWE